MGWLRTQTMTTADADHRRALEVQALLAGRSRHRALSLVDALVAAVAEARQLTVLHYDLDFEDRIETDRPAAALDRVAGIGRLNPPP